MNRLVLASGTVLGFAFLVATQACSSSDSGTGGTGNTGNTSAGGTGNASNGGSTATAGTSAGGSTAGGASSGGTSATAGTSAGGTTSTAGTSAGGTSSSGTGGGVAAMLCAAGETKNMPCTTATPEGMSCNKTCGITALGSVKAETCTSGTYMEGACTYPTAGDYTCYKKPATAVTCDGAVSFTDTQMPPVTGIVVQSGGPCTVADCAPCGPYQDGSHKVKTGGLCVCKMGTGGTSKWVCASATEWPPQAP